MLLKKYTQRCTYVLPVRTSTPVLYLRTLCTKYTQRTEVLRTYVLYDLRRSRSSFRLTPPSLAWTGKSAWQEMTQRAESSAVGGGRSEGRDPLQYVSTFVTYQCTVPRTFVPRTFVPPYTPCRYLFCSVRSVCSLRPVLQRRGYDMMSEKSTSVHCTLPR